MYCLPHLPEWQELVPRFWSDVSNSLELDPLNAPLLIFDTRPLKGTSSEPHEIGQQPICQQLINKLTFDIPQLCVHRL